MGRVEVVTQAKRTRMSPEQRRAQLIELGVTQLAGKHAADVSLDDVAEAAGVSRALVFHYFESKQDFYVAVLREQSKRMLERTAPDLAGDDPIAILRESLSAYIDYVDEYRESYVGLLRGSGAGADAAAREVVAATQAVMVERVLGQASRLSIPRTPIVELAVRGWISFVEEVTIGWLTGADVTRDQLLVTVTNALPAIAAVTVATSVEQ